MRFHDACMLRFSDFVGFATSFPVPERLQLTRHGRFLWKSQLFPCVFWMVSLNSLSSGSSKEMPLNFRQLSSFGFSIAHCCFAFRWAAYDIPDQFSDPQNDQVLRLIECLSALWTMKTRLEVFHLMLSTAWNLSKSQISFDRHPCSNNHLFGFLATHPTSCVFSWSRQYFSVVLENDSSFGTQGWLNSKFDEVTINVIPSIDQKSFRATCHPSLCLSPETRPNLLQDLWALRLFRIDPVLRWIFRYPESPPNNFTAPSAIGNMLSEPFSAWLFPLHADASKISRSSMSATKIHPFHILTRVQCTSKE